MQWATFITKKFSLEEKIAKKKKQMEAAVNNSLKANFLKKLEEQNTGETKRASLFFAKQKTNHEILNKIQGKIEDKMSRKMQNLFIQNINQFGTSSIQSGFVLSFLDNHLGSKASAFYEDDEVEKVQNTSRFGFNIYKSKKENFQRQIDKKKRSSIIENFKEIHRATTTKF